MYRDIQKMEDTHIYKLALLVVFSITVIFLYGMYVQIIKGHPWGTSPISNRTLVLTFLFIVLLDILAITLLRSMELVVEVRKDGIYYRMKPFHSSMKRVGFDEIERIEFPRLKKYGIGIHFGPRWKAFTVMGNHVKIVRKNGTFLILSVKDPEKFRDSINIH